MNANALASFVPIIILFVIMYFMMIRPQKKKDAQMKEMIANLKVGDNIITIGGIMGKIVIVKDDYVCLETSGEKSRIDIMKWGINAVVNKTEDLKA
ncbi:preprotein translocase subunit YajC [Anaerosphaera aminiphila DSM 21120]|uniref:Preprotein translocase subunit YajC n=1 Tax=Anaerosphaera aminiphila DSM 21120 TaxID=1120995 RepID=A0A1M5REZ4_9FIRM|nr:preprotein translocase subunit YajC [Anaerosphaera aminiphila]SHH24841.1 preprotein translocase subunit YajC [Anaerosphaera aminiphila DSM 21120]